MHPRSRNRTPSRGYVRRRRRHTGRGAHLSDRRPLPGRICLAGGYLRRERSGLDRPLSGWNPCPERSCRWKRASGHAPVHGRAPLYRLLDRHGNGRFPGRGGTVPVRGAGILAGIPPPGRRGPYPRPGPGRRRVHLPGGRPDRLPERNGDCPGASRRAGRSRRRPGGIRGKRLLHLPAAVGAGAAVPRDAGRRGPLQPAGRKRRPGLRLPQWQAVPRPGGHAEPYPQCR